MSQPQPNTRAIIHAAFAVAAVVLMAVLPANANPYLALRAGPAWWSDTSNDNEVETGSEAGVTNPTASTWQ